MPNRLMTRENDREPYTFDDGFVEVSIVQGGAYRVPLADYQALLDAWTSGVWKFLTFRDVSGATVNVLTHSIEAVILRDAASIAESNRLQQADDKSLPFDL